MRRRPWQYEPELFLVSTFCTTGTTAVDVGGHNGVFSREMARSGASVVVCEPNAALMRRLHTSVRGDVRFVPVALSDHVGSAEFRYSDAHDGNSTIEANNDLASVYGENHFKTVCVETATLDSLDLCAVSFVKIDVEGHEEAVLNGAAATILRDRPVLLVETEARHNVGAPERVFALTRSFGYDGYFLRLGSLETIANLSLQELSLPEAQSTGTQYVNNFIFLPSDRPKLLISLTESVRGIPANFKRAS